MKQRNCHAYQIQGVRETTPQALIQLVIWLSKSVKILFLLLRSKSRLCRKCFSEILRDCDKCALGLVCRMKHRVIVMSMKMTGLDIGIVTTDNGETGAMMIGGIDMITLIDTMIPLRADDRAPLSLGALMQKSVTHVLHL